MDPHMDPCVGPWARRGPSEGGRITMLRPHKSGGKPTTEGAPHKKTTGMKQQLPRQGVHLPQDLQPVPHMQKRREQEFTGLGSIESDMLP